MPVHYPAQTAGERVKLDIRPLESPHRAAFCVTRIFNRIRPNRPLAARLQRLKCHKTGPGHLLLKIVVHQPAKHRLRGLRPPYPQQMAEAH